jgi:hypothetical protein
MQVSIEACVASLVSPVTKQFVSGGIVDVMSSLINLSDDRDVSQIRDRTFLQIALTTVGDTAQSSAPFGDVRSK